jgi:hypothetical protein
MNKAIRHGEVSLIPVEKLPKGTKSVHDLFIVGHSETGHHHVLESKALQVITTDKEELYLRLFEPGKLVHQKTVNRHNDLMVQPGIYRITHKTEYDPFAKVTRRVFD